MIELQVISKLINTGDYSIITDNNITQEYFENTGYISEFDYITEHYNKYGNVPDKATFLEKFPEIELVDVLESNKYLVDTLCENYLYRKSVVVVQKVAELLQTDANAATEYLATQMKTLQPSNITCGVDIISTAYDRYNKYLERKQNQGGAFFTSGFNELDEVIHGIKREEELLVILARTNQGKSWILEKMCTHIWQLGFNVGYISPEMGDISIGFRFDTLYKNFSNSSLVWGKDDVDSDEYKQYIDNLKKHKNKFIVATPSDFDKKITISKLKNFIVKNDLHAIAVDGITYLTDERYRRGDSKTTTLTNISEDLMSLSVELKVPVIVVVQANRNAVGEDNKKSAPELETIRDSDGIAFNASKVLSIVQKDAGVLEIGIKKQREGKVGGKILYQWSINTGEFTYMPSLKDSVPVEQSSDAVHRVRNKYKDSEDVF